MSSIQQLPLVFDRAKWCRTCAQPRPVSDFYSHTTSRDGLHFECKSCSLARNRKRYQERPETHRNKRAYNLARKWNITEAEFQAMSDAQGGVCAICQQKPNRWPLVIDHDHDTGHVRALLCRTCNIAIGALRDSSMLSRAAAEYLERYGK